MQSCRALSYFLRLRYDTASQRGSIETFGVFKRSVNGPNLMAELQSPANVSINPRFSQFAPEQQQSELLSEKISNSIALRSNQNKHKLGQKRSLTVSDSDLSKDVCIICYPILCLSLFIACPTSYYYLCSSFIR